MIAFLERSSSSEDDNHDHEHEEGGRRSSSRNKSQLHSMCYPPTKVLERHSASHLHSPNKTQCTLPSRGTVHHLFSFSAPSPGLVVGQYEGRVGHADGRRRNDQFALTKLVSCLTLTPVHTGSGSRSPFVPTGSPFVSTVSPFPSTDTHLPFVSPHSGSPFPSTATLFAQAPIDIVGLYKLGYRQAPLPLSALPTKSSGSVPPFSAVPIPLAVESPGQQHARPLLLPSHNGQLLLDPPSFQCWCGKREGVTTTVTEFWFCHTSSWATAWR